MARSFPGGRVPSRCSLGSGLRLPGWDGLVTRRGRTSDLRPIHDAGRDSVVSPKCVGQGTSLRRFHSSSTTGLADDGRMCNLYTNRTSEKDIREAFDVAEWDDAGSLGDPKHWPMRPALVVRPRPDEGPGREAASLRWGLVP